MEVPIRKFLCLVSFLLLIVTFSFAEEESANQNLVNQIGVWAGVSTGQGLSYRYKPSDWSIQFQFLPYYYKEDCYFSLGLNFNKYLVEYRFTALYLYVGGSATYQGFLDYIYDEDYYFIETKRKYQTTLTLGVGPGFELRFGRFVINLGAGYMGAFVVYPEFDMIVNFTMDLGVYYKF